MYLNKDLTEKELLKDLMLSEKLLSISYSDSIAECCCPILRNTLLETLGSIQEIQYSICEALDNRGWNKIRLVNERELKSLVEFYYSLI